MWASRSKALGQAWPSHPAPPFPGPSYFCSHDVISAISVLHLLNMFPFSSTEIYFERKLFVSIRNENPAPVCLT